jgi:hypothetical protein
MMQPNKLTFHIPIPFVEGFKHFARNLFEEYIEEYLIEIRVGALSSNRFRESK